jgi:hypothetical protein
MVGGPIGGLIADKILKSPSKYLFYTFCASTVAILVNDAVGAHQRHRQQVDIFQEGNKESEPTVNRMRKVASLRS